MPDLADGQMGWGGRRCGIPPHTTDDRAGDGEGNAHAEYFGDLRQTKYALAVGTCVVGRPRRPPETARLVPNPMPTGLKDVREVKEARNWTGQPNANPSGSADPQTWTTTDRYSAWRNATSARFASNMRLRRIASRPPLGTKYTHAAPVALSISTEKRGDNWRARAAHRLSFGNRQTGGPTDSHTRPSGNIRDGSTGICFPVGRSELGQHWGRAPNRRREIRARAHRPDKTPGQHSG